MKTILFFTLFDLGMSKVDAGEGWGFGGPCSSGWRLAQRGITLARRQGNGPPMMASIVGFLAAMLGQIDVRAVSAPDVYGIFDYLVDKAQTTEGMLIIAGVVVGAWGVFRLFR